MQFTTISAIAAFALTAAALPQGSPDVLRSGAGIGSVSTRTVVSQRANKMATRADSKGTVVYWGQGPLDPDLGSLCEDDSAGISTVVMSFVTEYGKGVPIGANFGKHCQYPNGDCSAVEKGMAACHAAGKRLYLSIGGFLNKGTLANDDDAKNFADGLWAQFGPMPSGGTDGPRAFGEQFVDGFDFDLEHPDDPALPFYPTAINRLRENFSKAEGTFVIAGAPMCSLTKTTMTDMVKRAKFDELLVQFYNDECAATRPDKFNLDDFPDMLSDGESKDAKVYVGLPSAPQAANDGPGSKEFYFEVDKLTDFLGEWKDNENFAGVMLWDSSHAMGNVKNDCNYMQQVASIMSTGKGC
jgi:chitinase